MRKLRLVGVEEFAHGCKKNWIETLKDLQLITEHNTNSNLSLFMYLDGPSIDSVDPDKTMWINTICTPVKF
jgi:hypothetical protein